MLVMEAKDFYTERLSYPDFESIKDSETPFTAKGVVKIMEDYAREKIKEFILFYNDRQHRHDRIALKDEMELFYDEN